MKSDLTCTKCGYRTDTTECLADPDAAPTKGDLNICLNCGGLYLFEGAGSKPWRRMTRKEYRDLPRQIKAELARMESGRRIVITEDLAFNQKLRGNPPRVQPAPPQTDEPP